MLPARLDPHVDRCLVRGQDGHVVREVRKHGAASALPLGPAGRRRAGVVSEVAYAGRARDVRHQRASAPLGRNRDIAVRKPLIGRVLNYGRFVFESVAEVQGISEIRCVAGIGEP